MKRVLKKISIVLVSIIVLAIISGFIGWRYIKSTFFDFEKQFTENSDIKELTVDGYTFLDRNGNEEIGSL